MDILIIEDDKILQEYLKKELEKRNFSVTTTDSVKDAIKNNYARNHEIVILDLVLNDERGEDFLRYVQKENINIPILVLSSLTNTINKVELLKGGVDDYMTKPFEVNELIARIDAIKRRYIKNSNTIEKYKEITFYWNENKVIREDKEIFLTKKECKLLKLLVLNKGKVVKSDDILKKVWNVGPGYHSNILQSLIRHLRKNIDAEFDVKLIKNIHGVGYMILIPQ